MPLYTARQTPVFVEVLFVCWACRFCSTISLDYPSGLYSVPLLSYRERRACAGDSERPEGLLWRGYIVVISPRLLCFFGCRQLFKEFMASVLIDALKNSCAYLSHFIDEHKLRCTSLPMLFSILPGKGNWLQWTVNVVCCKNWLLLYMTIASAKWLFSKLIFLCLAHLFLKCNGLFVDK